MNKLIFFQFYPGDWVRDTRTITAFERGIWMDTLCEICRSPKIGWAINSLDDWCRLWGVTHDEARSAFVRLQKVAIVTVWNDDAIRICSRRMIKDELKREEDRNKKRVMRKSEKTEDWTFRTLVETELYDLVPKLFPDLTPRPPATTKRCTDEQRLTPICPSNVVSMSSECPETPSTPQTKTTPVRPSKPFPKMERWHGDGSNSTPIAVNKISENGKNGDFQDKNVILSPVCLPVPNNQYPITSTRKKESLPSENSVSRNQSSPVFENPVSENSVQRDKPLSPAYSARAQKHADDIKTMKVTPEELGELFKPAAWEVAAADGNGMKALSIRIGKSEDDILRFVEMMEVPKEVFYAWLDDRAGSDFRNKNNKPVTATTWQFDLKGYCRHFVRYNPELEKQKPTKKWFENWKKFATDLGISTEGAVKYTDIPYELQDPLRRFATGELNKSEAMKIIANL